MVNSIHEMLRSIGSEVERAQIKFPDPNCSMTALVEEVGELAKALLQEPAAAVRVEAVHVAAMAIRIAIEGDPSIEPLRSSRGLDPVHW